MKRERLSPVDFYEREVLPRLTADMVYGGLGFTSRGGRYWRGPCPLHNGKDSNFSVDSQTLGWRCFSRCGGGSALAFLNGGTSPRGADFVEVVKRAATLAGVDASPLERDLTPEEENRYHERERRRSLFEVFLEQARAALLEDKANAARAYLEARGFPEDCLKDLDLGLFTTPADVKAGLAGAGFTADELEASGLLKDGRWEGRLVGAWRDRWGHVETFFARDLTGKADEGAKYLYRAGTRKEDLVAFGLDVALKNEEGRKDLVLVEGVLDVVSLHRLGFRNVAAIGGAGRELSAKRWESLAALGVRAVTLVLDDDEPGRTGTLAALENVSKGSNVPVVYVVDPADLAPCKDPDELVRKKGLGAFCSVLSKAYPREVYHVRALLGDVTPGSPARERRDAADRVLGLRFIDPLGREDALRLTGERTGYSLEALAEVEQEVSTRRLNEEAERKLDDVLREAQSSRTAGRSAFEVASSLRERLAPLYARDADAPPFFDVDRLLQESRELPAGKPSGWDALDKLEARFNPGELVLLGARTGHGKTSALLCLLWNWLEMEEDELLVLYSHEEPEARVFHRLLAIKSLSWAPQPGGGWTANEARDFLRDVNSRPNWPAASLDTEKEQLRSYEGRLLVVHRPAWSVENLAAHALGLAERHKVGAVLVDYLQRVPGPEARFDRRDIEVSAVARGLKSLAVALSCPVVAAAQINREAVPDRYRENLRGKSYDEARDVIRSARPQLHHLREGGSEQEADLVLGLLNYRADFETDVEGEGRAKGSVPDVTRFEVGALKNRYGTPGRWATLAFEGRRGLLRDANREGEV